MPASIDPSSISERASRLRAVPADLADVRREQRKRLPRELVGHRVLLVPARIGLDRVDHGVDAGRGRDGGGQAERQLRVEDRPVGQEAGRRRRPSSRSSASSRWRSASPPSRCRRWSARGQRQALAFGEADAVDGVERARRTWRGRRRASPCRGRCRRRWRAPVRPPLAGERGRGLDHVRGRVGDHVLEHDRSRAAPPGSPRRPAVSPALAHALVGDEQARASPPTRATSSAIFFAAPGSNRTLGGAWKVNGFIRISPGQLGLRRWLAPLRRARPPGPARAAPRPARACSRCSRSARRRGARRPP